MLILLFKNRKDFSDSRYKLELNSKNAILRTRNLIYHEIIYNLNTCMAYNYFLYSYLHVLFIATGYYL